MAKIALQISASSNFSNAVTFGSGNSSYYPAPEDYTPAWNALDSDKTGRNNNNGGMKRVKVADKNKYSIQLPSGLTNAQVSAILGIVKSASFYVKACNAITGAFDSKHVYCTSCEPKIDKITSFNSSGEPTGWVYDAFSINVIEM